LNKPLIFGYWADTRALADTEFERNAGIWNTVKGVEYRPADKDGPGRIALLGGGLPSARSSSTESGVGARRLHTRCRIPLAFGLDPEKSYRWTLVYRLGASGEAAFVAGRNPPHALPPTEHWTTIRIPVAGGDEYLLQSSGAPLEVRSVRLRRRMAHPFDSQFFFYLRQLARLDFGISSSTNQPVSRMIRDGILPSLTLTVPIFAIGLLTALCLALVCAFYRDALLDRFFVVFSVALMSVNYLVWIILGQYLLGFRLGAFPVWGYESWHHLLLPVLIGVVSGLGANVRFYRTIMLDEMYRDYVRTAFAKGAGKRRVLFTHVLKNAMVPVVTNVVIAIPFLYAGSLLLESFFGIPGLGYMAINAINSSDVDVIRAVVLIGAILFVVANLVTDLCYALVDPRVKLG
jgi:peptide/nickel transport system permease protein